MSWVIFNNEYPHRLYFQLRLHWHACRLVLPVQLVQKEQEGQEQSPVPIFRQSSGSCDEIEGYES